MQAKAKANSVITHRMNGDGTLTITVLGVGDLVFDPRKASAECRARAEVHGWLQRLPDAAAIPFNKAENRYATPQEKYEAIRALRDHYETGTSEWSRRAAATGPRVDSESILILRAVAKVQGCEVDVMRERVKAMAEKREVTQRAYLANLLKNDAVKTAYDELKAEQPVIAVVDPDEALNELGGQS